MIRKLGRVILPLLVAIILSLVTVPVSAAVANPDSIALNTVKVFQNIFEDDDVLFVTSYEVEYGYDVGTAPEKTPEPTESASVTFETAILSADSSTLIQRRALEYYQYNIHSIYFSATDAASLVWGSEYNVRLQGTPTYFTLVEDVTMDTVTLSSSHWISGTMTESRELLRQYGVNLAADLEDNWGIVLLVTTTDYQVLNSAGRIVFLGAIPNLESAVSRLFQVSSTTASVTTPERTAAYEDTTSIENNLGVQLKAAFDGVGDSLNISGQQAAFLWIMLFALVVASIVFLSSNNSTAAMVLTIPIILIGAWTGAIQLAILFVFAAIVVLFVGYHIWLKGL